MIGVSRQEKGEAMKESAAKGGGGNVRGRKGVARREEVEERKKRGRKGLAKKGLARRGK